MDERQWTAVEEWYKDIVSCIELHIKRALLDFSKKGAEDVEMRILQWRDIQSIQEGTSYEKAVALISLLKAHEAGFRALIAALNCYGRPNLARKLEEHAIGETVGASSGDGIQTTTSNEPVETALEEHLRSIYARRSQYINTYWLGKLKELSFEKCYTLPQIINVATSASVCEQCMKTYGFLLGRECHRVLEGEPGFGKTTFLAKLVLDWTTRAACDFSKQFRYLFHLQLDKRKIWPHSLAEIICKAVSFSNTSFIDKVLTDHPKKVFLVIDGLDDCHQKLKNYLIDLFTSNDYPFLTWLIAARPGRSARRLTQGSTFRIRGFSSKKAAEFVQCQLSAQFAIRSVGEFFATDFVSPLFLTIACAIAAQTDHTEPVLAQSVSSYNTVRKYFDFLKCAAEKRGSVDNFEKCMLVAGCFAFMNEMCDVTQNSEDIVNLDLVPEEMVDCYRKQRVEQTNNSLYMMYQGDIRKAEEAIRRDAELNFEHLKDLLTEAVQFGLLYDTTDRDGTVNLYSRPLYAFGHKLLASYLAAFYLHCYLSDDNANILLRVASCNLQLPTCKLREKNYRSAQLAVALASRTLGHNSDSSKFLISMSSVYVAGMIEDSTYDNSSGFTFDLSWSAGLIEICDIEPKRKSKYIDDLKYAIDKRTKTFLSQSGIGWITGLHGLFVTSSGNKELLGHVLDVCKFYRPTDKFVLVDSVLPDSWVDALVICNNFELVFCAVPSQYKNFVSNDGQCVTFSKCQLEESIVDYVPLIPEIEFHKCSVNDKGYSRTSSLIQPFHWKLKDLSINGLDAPTSFFSNLCSLLSKCSLRSLKINGVQSLMLQENENGWQITLNQEVYNVPRLLST